MSGLRILQRTAGAVGLSVAVLSAGLLVGGTAFAHDPIIITDDQTTPEAGPLLPDGTISFALYGVIDAPGATRGLRVRFADSQTLNVTLLVPALDPERALADGDLPTLTVHRPDGSTAVLTANERVRFDESFSGTSYLRGSRHRAMRRRPRVRKPGRKRPPDRPARSSSNCSDHRPNA